MAEEPVTNNELEEVDEDDTVDNGEVEEESSSDDRRSERKKEESPRERRDQQRPRYNRRQQGSSEGRSGFRRSSPRGRYQPRRRVCTFCADKVKMIDWKNIDNLRRFINSNGSIRARRKTGTCAKHQRQLAVAIKRARHLALTPFTEEHVRLYGRR